MTDKDWFKEYLDARFDRVDARFDRIEAQAKSNAKKLEGLERLREQMRGAWMLVAAIVSAVVGTLVYFGDAIRARMGL